MNPKAGTVFGFLARKSETDIYVCYCRNLDVIKPGSGRYPSCISYLGHSAWNSGAKTVSPMLANGISTSLLREIPTNRLISEQKGEGCIP